MQLQDEWNFIHKYQSEQKSEMQPMGFCEGETGRQFYLNFFESVTRLSAYFQCTRPEF